ncbi:hypothetical protein GGQ03_000565 [Salinibacter ruber]|uniref:VCBS repeat-containing protein n=1 Tax=Salinibacter ruber TaxID=146919 RepID=UPI0021675A1C|nr:VCBS repeat-containing protein [Salinibacter ruber]MCS4153308.1 hypothetical protein [Salinibacter ruber]
MSGQPNYQFLRLSGVVVLLLLITTMACTEKESSPSDPLFERIPSSETGVQFSNDISEDQALNVITFEYMYNGAGVGVGDVNNDGRPDLFFASNMGKSRLYLNKGDFQFEEITNKAGIETKGKWANGVSMVDINHDGHLDIYVSVGGPYTSPERRSNELYVNNGDSTFTERAESYGLADTGHTTQTAFFDYDKDGDLDAYLLTSGFGEEGSNVVRPKKTDGEAVNTDRLYRNEGNGTFINVSAEADIQTEGHGLGLAIVDVNRDGWPDIYAANDYLSNDLLYVNNQDGTFAERAGSVFRHQSYAAMGTDAADINNDGWRDIVTLDMLPPTNNRLKQMYGTVGERRYRSEMQNGYDPQVKRNTLQLHAGLAPDTTPAFSEIGALSGIQATDWSWSPLLADFDNDGWRDLFVTNGLPRDITDRDFANYKLRLLQQQGNNPQTVQALFEKSRNLDGAYLHNFLFQNNGDLTFTDRSEDWGMSRPSYSMGAAYADLDGDGDLDLVTNNLNHKASLYRNTATERKSNNYLQVILDGPPKNKRGLGAQVLIYEGGERRYARQSVYRGYKSSVSGTLHFGLGDTQVIDSLVVTWPDSQRQSLDSVRANQEITLRYSEGRTSQRAIEEFVAPSLFTGVTEEVGLSFRHRESYYSDFKQQPLLPHKFSQGGPGLAVGDVNGDGREDLFVGGAFKQSGRVYLQQADGTFEGSVLSTGANYEEDMGALFFDANGDGNLDLYVASGGSEFEAGSKYYQDRLYLGDGTGDFTEAPDRLPLMHTSSSVVTAADYDRDGDLDLFVGSRVHPTQYPVSPESHLLENRGGRFVDVTESVAPTLQKVGLVTGALWTSIDGDPWRDLVVVGEWMPISVFENQGGRLAPVTDSVGLSNTVGWWNSITSGDFDRDGDTDYVVGNLGKNTLLKNTSSGPVRMHFGDFNGDGRTDPIISRHVGDTSYPIHFRNDVLRQLPFLKQRYSSFETYAQTPMAELLPADRRSKATVYRSNTFETSYVENTEDGFEVRALPLRSQFGPVFGLESGHYDNDGNRDLLLVGNSHATEPFTGRYDALHGALLEIDETGSFTYVDGTNNGFYVEGDATALVEVESENGGRLVVSARNDGALKAFRVQKSGAQKVLELPPLMGTAEMHYENGDIERVEIYHGSGYLSQSGNNLTIPSSVERVTLETQDGDRRTWRP